MTTMPFETIRRLPNGSIDTAYYLKRGRIARSRQAYALMARLGRFLRRLAGLVAQERETPAAPAPRTTGKATQTNFAVSPAQTDAVTRKAA